MNDRKTLLAFFGHHKCGTRWINSIIRLVCRDLNLKFAYADNPSMFENKLDWFVKENDVDFFSYTNADIRFVRAMDNFLGFHVIRDPRDIVVSAYFSHLYSHTTEGWSALLKHREKLEKASQAEGLFIEMEFRKGEFRALDKWDYSQKNVLEIKMEDIMSSPYETTVEAFSHLKLVEETPSQGPKTKVFVNRLLGFIYKHRYSKLAKGRKQGEEDVKSHYRKGVAGDWTNYFNEEHCRYFEENYNDLLFKLGYENTSNWSSQLNFASSEATLLPN